jgi:hypothetical protein
MRFRDEKPGDLDRARTAVAAWREQHPAGSDAQLIVDIGAQFHPDYGPVLRGVLAAVDRRRARRITGALTEPPRAAR